MRHLRSVLALCSSMLVLVGCGQSGALHLPKDAQQDKRAHYLIYPNKDPQAQTNVQQQTQGTAQATQPQSSVPQPDAQNSASSVQSAP